MAMKFGFAAFAGGFFLFLLGNHLAPTATALSSALYLGAIVLGGLAMLLFLRGK